MPGMDRTSRADLSILFFDDSHLAPADRTQSVPTAGLRQRQRERLQQSPSV